MRIDTSAREVTALGRRVRAAVFLRSFVVQGSWNYRTLIGTGFAFALLPALRSIYRDDPEGLSHAVDRHTRLFNSHPYLAPIALGAVATLEARGEDKLLIERFKTAVRGSLGTLGDRLIWAGWRPVCLLFALALLFAGAAWWLVIVGFLVLYNAGQLVLRGWGYRLGLREGVRVGEHLRRSPLGQLQHLLTVTGAFLIGLLLPLVAAGWHLPAGGDRPLPWVWIAASLATAALGLRFGPAIRRPAVFSLLGFTLLGLLLRMLP